MSAGPTSRAKRVKSKKIHIAGIHTDVFGLEEIGEASEVAVAFWLHGRLGKSQDLHTAIHHVYSKLESSHVTLPLLIVVFDQRNHGARLVDRTKNFAWRDFADEGSNELTNPTHALDMYSIQCGTASDVLLLLDFLSPALFPKDQVKVTRWICMGTSLGGHVTHIAGSKDPRLTHLVPFIGSPSILSLLENRAKQNNLAFSPPIMPDSLRNLLKRTDPFELSLDRWKGKHILALCGEEDPLVPYKEGKTEELISRLKERGEDVDLFVEKGIGHQVTKVMLDKATEWLVEKALVKDTTKAML